MSVDLCYLTTKTNCSSWTNYVNGEPKADKAITRHFVSFSRLFNCSLQWWKECHLHDDNCCQIDRWIIVLSDQEVFFLSIENTCIWLQRTIDMGSPWWRRWKKHVTCEAVIYWSHYKLIQGLVVSINHCECVMCVFASLLSKLTFHSKSNSGFCYLSLYTECCGAFLKSPHSKNLTNVEICRSERERERWPFFSWEATMHFSHHTRSMQASTFDLCWTGTGRYVEREERKHFVKTSRVKIAQQKAGKVFPCYLSIVLSSSPWYVELLSLSSSRHVHTSFKCILLFFPQDTFHDIFSSVRRCIGCRMWSSFTSAFLFTSHFNIVSHGDTLH